jgi:ParB family chromosome partitioning protein
MAEKKIKTRGLGRGLSTLMADVEADAFLKPAAGRAADMALPIEKIEPNPDQPRRQFTEADLADLAASIRAKGVIQPLIVRKSPKTAEMYEIVAGERRWRAAQMVQLHELPVLIREFNDTEVLEVAIIENIQRADLNPIEEAAGYRQLMDKFGHTQEKLADALGKSRSYIANLLRLLHLPEEVLELLRSGTLTAGHARALITSDTPGDLARQVVAGGLSVRATEALVKKSRSG